MVIKKSSSLINDFRKSRGQVTETVRKETPKNTNKKGFYDYFLVKYNNLEKYIDTFNCKDIVYFFKETAKESGYNYFIANMSKDTGIVKKLKTGYSNRDICGMIEFLFLSEQDYLDKKRLGIGILTSRWINTIYADMLLWVDDKYKPRGKKHIKGEWTKTENEDISIGDFL